jgi:hypothetical protein
MMFTSIRALALAVVALLVATAATTTSAQTVGDPCLVKMTPLCKRLAARWAVQSVWKAGGGEMLAAGFGEMGVLNPGHGNGYQGRTAIAAYFNTYLLPHFTQATFTTHECGWTSKTEAWERGTYTFMTGGNNATAAAAEIGNYMTIWTMNGDPSNPLLERTTLMTHKGATPVMTPVQKGAKAQVPAGVSPSTVLNVTTMFEALYFTRADVGKFDAVYLPNTLIISDEHSYFGQPAVQAFYTGLQTTGGIATVAVQLMHTYTSTSAAFFAATGTYRLIAGKAGDIEGATSATGVIMLVGYVNAATGRPQLVRQMTLHNKND